MAWDPEFGEGSRRRHCLTFHTGDANNCKSRKSDPQNGFHAPTMALVACR